MSTMALAFLFFLYSMCIISDGLLVCYAGILEQLLEHVTTCNFHHTLGFGLDFAMECSFLYFFFLQGWVYFVPTTCDGLTL